MTRLMILLALLFVGCSDETETTPEVSDASSLDMSTASDMGEEADVTDHGSGDAAQESDLAEAADTGTDAAADTGSGEPCPNGICSPQDCIDNGWIPPSNLQRDTRPLLNDSTVATTWEQFFGNPFPRGNTRFLEVDPDHYVSIEFDTNDFRNEGSIVFENPQGVGPWGSRLITINQCPGYFGPSPYPADPECREWKFAIANIDFTIGAEDSTFSCDLEPDRTYYLNIVPVDEVLPEGSEDLTWRCAIGDMTSDRWDTCGALMETTFIP